MATKLAVPRPSAKGKIQPKEKEKTKEVVLEATDLVVEEQDNTEPTIGPPVLEEEIVEEALVVEAAPIVQAAPTPTPIPPPPVLPGILIGPPPSSRREIAMSLPSQYELDSERKSSPPVMERRKQLAKYVASAVGVAWFICTCAIGETALRSIIGSMH